MGPDSSVISIVTEDQSAGDLVGSLEEYGAQFMRQEPKGEIALTIAQGAAPEAEAE